MLYLDTRHQKKSFTLTTILLSLLVLVLFYIDLTYFDPPIEKGIAVNFGMTDFGSGIQQPKQKIKSEPLNTPKPPEEVRREELIEQELEPETHLQKNEPAEKLLTQESETSLRIKQQKEAERKEQEKAKAEAIKKAEQEAKKKKLDALMGGIGKSDGDESGSEGDDNKLGDKGNPYGNPYATSYYGTPGSGTGGFGLNGRSLVNKGKVQQNCNEAGRVVVRIVVDQNGSVIKATPGVKGTTNNAPCLLEPAKKTALLHKWNLDANAPSQQIGFVVVNFKLGQ